MKLEGRLGKWLLWTGAVVMLLSCASLFFDERSFYRSYLVVFLYGYGLACGALTLLALHQLTGGRWGIAIQPYLLAMAKTMPLVAAFFLPVAVGLHYLYPWADHAWHPESAAKRIYLDPVFFLARSAAYLAAVNLMSFLICRRVQGAGGRPPGRSLLLSGIVLAVMGLVFTFSAVDWVMSLEPQWTSSMFGILFAVGQTLAALAFAVLMHGLNHRRESAIHDDVQPLRDLGNLLLAFVMLWSYLAFGEFLIIWSGNLPEEISWYTGRIRGGWELVAIALMVLHFAIPFMLLLGGAVKTRSSRLCAVAALILIMRHVHHVWTVKPSFQKGVFPVPWTDFLLPIGLGGIWLGALVIAFERWKESPGASSAAS